MDTNEPTSGNDDLRGRLDNVEKHLAHLDANFALTSVRMSDLEVQANASLDDELRRLLIQSIASGDFDDVLRARFGLQAKPNGA